MVISLWTGGHCRFLVGNEAIIPVILHQIAELIVVSVLEDLRLCSSLNLYSAIIVMCFGLNPLSDRCNLILIKCNRKLNFIYTII